MRLVKISQIELCYNKHLILYTRSSRLDNLLDSIAVHLGSRYYVYIKKLHDNTNFTPLAPETDLNEPSRV